MGLFSGSRVLGFHWGACLGASSQLKSQPCIFGEYVGLVFLAGHTGVPLVSASRDLGNSVQAPKSEIFRPTVPGPHRSSLNPGAPCSQCQVAPRLPPSKAHRVPRLPQRLCSPVLRGPTITSLKGSQGPTSTSLKGSVLLFFSTELWLRLFGPLFFFALHL